MRTQLRLAARSLARAGTYTAASVTTIALAVATACAVFALVNAVILRPLPYPRAERLVGMWHTLPGVDIPLAKQSLGTYVIYRENARSFEASGVFVSLAATLNFAASDASPERVRVAWTTPSVFDVLGARTLIGRLFGDADAAHGARDVALISEHLWRSRFAADPAIVGKLIDVDAVQRTIVGVMPASFAFPEPRTPVWIPLGATNPPYLGSFGYDGIGRLRPGVSIEAARLELTRILGRAAERFPEQAPGVSTATVLRKTRIAPVLHAMRDDVVAGFDHILWMTAAVVVLLVVVAFSNLASLVLVRIESRRRELTVRRALGASAAMVWRDLLLESGLVAAGGAVLGLVVGAFAIEVLVRIAPAGVPRLDEVRIDAPVISVAAVCLLSFALVTALIGLLRVRGDATIAVLHGGGRTGTISRSAGRLRSAFIGVEVAISLALLAGSGLLGRSMLRLHHVSPGFDASNVFTFWTFLPPASYRHDDDAAALYHTAIARFRELPGVVSVAATAKLPLEIEGFPYRVTIWGDDGRTSNTDLPPIVQATSTSSGYFETMRIPLIAGRTYDDATVRRGAREAVASRTYVEQVWHDPTGRTGVGKRIRPSANGPWFTIVGVVGDVRDSTLTLPAVPEVYFPEEPSGDTTGKAATTARDMAFVVRTRTPAPEIATALKRELHALDRNLPFHRPSSMEQIVADSRASMTFALIVLAVGAAATLALAIVGLYGAIAYVVALRAREISIRIAVGLDPAAAPSLMLREGASVVAAGAAAGVLVFVAFARLLGSLAFEVAPRDPSTIAFAIATVLAVATVAMLIPARRAARVNPADALKAD